jgi:hypothetical protein
MSITRIPLQHLEAAGAQEANQQQQQQQQHHHHHHHHHQQACVGLGDTALQRRSTTKCLVGGFSFAATNRTVADGAAAAAATTSQVCLPAVVIEMPQPHVHIRHASSVIWYHLLLSLCFGSITHQPLASLTPASTP